MSWPRFPAGDGRPVPPDDAADVVHAYSRRQAIADGVLVDVTRQASASEGFLGGFLVPVAVTAQLWAAIEAIPSSLQGIASARGRLHDVLWMGNLAVRRQARGFGRFPVSPEHRDDGVRADSSDPDGRGDPRSSSSPSNGVTTERHNDQTAFASVALEFAVHLPFAGTRKRTQLLRVDVGPDDDGMPCVTIGFPGDF